MTRKSRVAKLSIMSNSVLIVLKLGVGIMSGSVSIISEAIHSSVDLVAAVVAYIAVKFADKPPDKSHPYGHEKIENVSAVFETILIFFASAFIIKEAVHKLIAHSAVTSVRLGFVVMGVSAVVNYFVSKKLYAVAKEEGSAALEADALHLKVDVYTSLGVALGLLAIWITGLKFLDPLIAIIVALFILKEAFEMLSSSFGPLVDMPIDDADISKINNILAGYTDVLIDFHELRTRKAGNVKHIDLHILTPQKMTVREFHDICDKIEKDIEAAINNTKVIIHGEPCQKECDSCSFDGKDRFC